MQLVGRYCRKFSIDNILRHDGKNIAGFPVEGGAVVAVGAIRGLGINATQSVGKAYSAINMPKLVGQLTMESAKSPFTKTGTLTKEAINNSKVIFKPGELNNLAIPDGFGKYMTDSFRSPAGNFTVHYYKNQNTGAVYYGLDYKVIFNSMSGAVK